MRERTKCKTRYFEYGHRSVSCFVSLALVIGCSFSLRGQYSLDSFSIGPRGDSAGGNYSLTASIDDAASITSTASGGTYSLETGFWAITAVPTPGAPSLTVQSTATNTVVVSWPASGEGFELRQSSNLSNTTWTVPPQVVNTSGGTRFIIVSQQPGHRFYRLQKSSQSGPYEVVTLNDAGTGSLRAVIQAATNNATITFAPGLEGMITLNSELVVNKNLTLAGPGATVLAASGGNINRVFNIISGNVKISGLTIRDGAVRAAAGADAKGGGVFNSGALALANCALVANVALGGSGMAGVDSNGGPGGNGFGGGIYSTGSVVMINCTLALNEARGGNGGLGADRNADGGYNGGAAGDGLGGAICNDGTLAMTNCTFSLNIVAGGRGGNGGEGGLFKGRGGAGGDAEGAGVLNRLSCQAANVTITGGVAERGAGGIGINPGPMGVPFGGGFRTTTATAFFVNSLVAQNSLGSSIAVANGFDVSGTVVSQGYNLVGITNGSTAWVASDRVGNNLSPLDPLIETVEDNGGWTPTIALLPGSPAIDQGRAIGLTTDQRGLLRSYDLPGTINAPGGNGSDIGAFELNP